MYKIEKGVPLPLARVNHAGKGSTPVYPWTAMEVGDSFVCPHAQKVYATAYTNSVRTGRKYLIRKILPNTVRVWRSK